MPILTFLLAVIYLLRSQSFKHFVVIVLIDYWLPNIFTLLTRIHVVTFFVDL